MASIPEQFEGASQILPSWLSEDWSFAGEWSRGLVDEIRYALGRIERDIQPTLSAWDPEKNREVSLYIDELQGAIKGYHSPEIYRMAGQAYSRLQAVLGSLDQEEILEEPEDSYAEEHPEQ